jgi:hypothetical protein
MSQNAKFLSEKVSKMIQMDQALLVTAQCHSENWIKEALIPRISTPNRKKVLKNGSDLKVKSFLLNSQNSDFSRKKN